MTETADRPLVTFALFAYNQEQYIREAVEGAFSQTYEPLEIILSDDCSTDRTFEIMQEMAAAYEGPHEVSLRRNIRTVGVASHVNIIMQNARGEIVLLAAGDDISMPERTAISVDLLQQYQCASAVMLSADVINQTGKKIKERRFTKKKYVDELQTLNNLIAWEHETFGATRAIRRDSFTCFGPLRSSCPTEDTPLLLRSLLCGTNVISRRKAILYRQHATNLSRGASLEKMNTQEIYKQYEADTRRAVEQKLIPEERANHLCGWWKLDSEIRRLRIALAANEICKLRDVALAVRHPATRFREKVRFLFAYLSTTLKMSE